MSLAIAGLGAALLLGHGGMDSPIKEVVAYSREVQPGIPSGPGVEASPERSLETLYFVYVVMRQNSVPTAASVWLKGKLHDAVLEEVSTPVSVERDPVVPNDDRITLVLETSSPTYRILLGEEHPGRRKNEAENDAARDDDLVVVLTIAGTRWCASVETIERLPPVPGM